MDILNAGTFATTFMQGMLGDEAIQKIRDVFANRGQNLDLGPLGANLTERQKEIIESMKTASAATRIENAAVSGEGPASPSLQDLYSRFEEERKLGEQRMRADDVSNIDPAFLLVENFTRYLLDDVLLSQLDDSDKNTMFALFEDMHLKDAFGDGSGGLVYRHGSGSSFSPVTDALLMRDRSKMPFSSPESMRLSYNLFMSTRKTAQMYMLATFVPQKYFLRPEVKMAASAPLENGEFYRIFEHIIMTIAKEELFEAVVLFRGAASRLEHFCRVYRSRRGKALEFPAQTKTNLKARLAQFILRQVRDMKRRQSAKLAEKIVKDSDASRSQNSVASSAGRLWRGGSLNPFNYFFANIGAEGDTTSGGVFDSLSGLGTFVSNNVGSTLLSGAAAAAILQFMNAGKKSTADTRVLALQLSAAGADLSLKTGKDGERSYKNALAPLNTREKYAIIRKKVELGAYAVNYLAIEAELILNEALIVPIYRN